jgi:hypothetical protein
MVEISHLGNLKQRIIGIKIWYFFQLDSQVGIGDLKTLPFFLGLTAAVCGTLAHLLESTAATLVCFFLGALLVLVFLVYY